MLQMASVAPGVTARRTRLQLDVGMENRLSLLAIRALQNLEAVRFDEQRAAECARPQGDPLSSQPSGIASGSTATCAP